MSPGPVAGVRPGRLPLVDIDEYDPDDCRDRRDYEPVGLVTFTFENWRIDQAWHLFSKARLDWLEAHGWPGGLDDVELFQETAQMRRQSTLGSAENGVRASGATGRRIRITRR